MHTSSLQSNDLSRRLSEVSSQVTKERNRRKAAEAKLEELENEIK